MLDSKKSHIRERKKIVENILIKKIFFGTADMFLYYASCTKFMFSLKSDRESENYFHVLKNYLI
jgi:hypothetical protein